MSTRVFQMKIKSSLKEYVVRALKERKAFSKNDKPAGVFAYKIT